MDGQFWQVPPVRSGDATRSSLAAAVDQAATAPHDTAALHLLAALYAQKAADALVSARSAERAAYCHAAARALQLLRAACLRQDRALELQRVAPAGADALFVLLAQADAANSVTCLRLARAHDALAADTAAEVRAPALAAAAYWRSRTALAHLPAAADEHAREAVLRLAHRCLTNTDADAHAHADAQRLLRPHAAALAAQLAVARQETARRRIARGDFERAAADETEPLPPPLLAADAAAADALPPLSVRAERRLDEELALAANMRLARQRGPQPAAAASPALLRPEQAAQLLAQHAPALLGASAAALAQSGSGAQTRQLVLVAVRAALAERLRWLDAHYAREDDAATVEEARAILATLDATLGAHVI